ncbi:MAG: hypothetical protein METHAR1v1_760008 [Methanothrix sp.]|nr:MAG: hypothetical protein METHAR1v1_760008 [Methanothrix sp.]
MGQLGVEDLRVCVLLEVVVGTVVQRLDHHLFAPLPGEEDEGDLRVPAPDPFEKGYPVHLRHHVVGDDDVIAAILQPLRRLQSRDDGVDLYIPGPLEEYLRYLQDCGVVVHHKNSDHSNSPACSIPRDGEVSFNNWASMAIMPFGGDLRIFGPFKFVEFYDH